MAPLILVLTPLSTTGRLKRGSRSAIGRVPSEPRRLSGLSEQGPWAESSRGRVLEKNVTDHAAVHYRRKQSHGVRVSPEDTVSNGEGATDWQWWWTILACVQRQLLLAWQSGKELVYSVGGPGPFALMGVGLVCIALAIWVWRRHNQHTFTAVKFATVKILDVLMDILSVVTYFQSGYLVFGAISLLLLLGSSTLSYVSLQLITEKPLCTWRLLLHWTQLHHVVDAINSIRYSAPPSSQFMTNFLELVCESAPQAGLQSYTAILGVGADSSVFGIPGTVILQVKTMSSLVMLAVEISAFSATPYASERPSPQLYARISVDVVIRVLGYAVLGNALRPPSWDMHAFNWPFWLVMGIQYCICLAIVLNKSAPPFDQSPTSFISALVCFMCMPPSCFGDLQATVPLIALARVVEIYVMAVATCYWHGPGRILAMTLQVPLFAVALVVCLPLYVFVTLSRLVELQIALLALALTIAVTAACWVLAHLPTQVIIAAAMIVGVAGIILLLVACVVSMKPAEGGQVARCAQELGKAILLVAIGTALAVGIGSVVVVYALHSVKTFLHFVAMKLVFALPGILAGVMSCALVASVVRDDARASTSDESSQSLVDRSTLYNPSIHTRRGYTFLWQSDDEAASMESSQSQDQLIAASLQTGGKQSSIPAPIFGSVIDGEVHMFDILVRYTSMGVACHPSTGQRPLSWGASQGRPEAMARFVDHFSELIRSSDENSGASNRLISKYVMAGILDAAPHAGYDTALWPWHEAMERFAANPHLIPILLQSNSNSDWVRSTMPSGEPVLLSAVRQACQSGQDTSAVLAGVEALLLRGADPRTRAPDSSDSRGDSALVSAVRPLLHETPHQTAIRMSPKIAQKLLQHQADPDAHLDGVPLVLALAKWLIRYTPSPSMQVEETSHQYTTPSAHVLGFPVAWKTEEKLQRLVKEDKVTEHPVHGVLTLLLESRADPDAKDDDGSDRTALHHACHHLRYDIARLFKNAGADLRIKAAMPQKGMHHEPERGEPQPAGSAEAEKTSAEAEKKGGWLSRLLPSGRSKKKGNEQEESQNMQEAFDQASRQDVNVMEAQRMGNVGARRYSPIEMVVKHSVKSKADGIMKKQKGTLTLDDRRVLIQQKRVDMTRQAVLP